MGIKEEIREYGKNIGIDLIGFTTAEPFDKAERAIKDSIEKGFGFPHLNEIVHLRCTPRQKMSEARSIISAAMSYNITPENLPPKPDSSFIGLVSRYAVGMNYQRIMREKLRQVMEFINGIKSVKYKIFVGGSSMVDRTVAQRAGIGWFGANTCLFTRDYGSWVFLGNILTDLEIEPDEPMENQCNECYRCVEACPTGALIKPGVINPYRCLSYITQMRGYVPRELRPLMANKIFGCDTCQQACPRNRQAIYADHSEFLSIINPNVDLISLLLMSKKEFEKSFGKTIIGRGSKDIIQRNAVIALGNYCDKRTVGILQEALHHPSSMVHEHAAWALAQMDGC